MTAHSNYRSLMMGNECAVILSLIVTPKEKKNSPSLPDPSKIQESLKKCSKTKHVRKAEKDRDREGGKEIKNCSNRNNPKNSVADPDSLIPDPDRAF
jgi:hypothetical protein